MLDFFLPKIGIDGCGKETCATLACYLAEHKIYRVPLSHNYAYLEFKEDFKKVFMQAGLEGNPSALIVSNLNLDQVSTFCFYYLLKFNIYVGYSQVAQWSPPNLIFEKKIFIYGPINLPYQFFSLFPMLIQS